MIQDEIKAKWPDATHFRTFSINLLEDEAKAVAQKLRELDWIVRLEPILCCVQVRAVTVFSNPQFVYDPKPQDPVPSHS